MIIVVINTKHDITIEDEIQGIPFCTCHPLMAIIYGHLMVIQNFIDFFSSKGDTFCNQATKNIQRVDPRSSYEYIKG